MLLGQNTMGQVEAVAYTKTEYAAGAQNWAMAKDDNGRMYVANNEGLLVYNGTNWQLFPVTNKTILRSIGFAADGKLYAGAQDELGYYAPDGAGRLIYTSLKKMLPPAHKTFADVWDIEVADKEVFFRATDKIIRLYNNQVTVYPSASSWIGLCRNNGQVVVQDEKEGLFVFRNGQLRPLIAKSSLPEGFYMTDMMPYAGDTSLVSTSKNGLHLLADGKLLPFTIKNIPGGQYFTSLAVLDDNSFFAGTYSNGIYHINHRGEVLGNISTENALQNNTIRCLYADAAGNLWTGLDNGISYIPYSGAIKHINPPAFNKGAGYAVTAFDGYLYFALSTGLQRLPLTSATDLSAVTAEPDMILNGLTWNVAAAGNHLLAGRDDGLWKISGSRATPVSAVSGFWNYQPVSPAADAAIAAGYYTGIRLFSYRNGGFTDEGAVKNFSESSRYVETDGANIWVSHPYRGVFRIPLAGNTIIRYTAKKGLPSDLDNHVFKIKNQIVFATPKGIYEYSAGGDTLVPAQKYAALFGEMPLRYLKEDEKGNIWFVRDKMPGVADFSGPQPVIHFIPELDKRILSGFESVYPYNTQNVLVGAGSGFYHINYDKYKQTLRPFKAYVTLLKMTGRTDSILYGGYSAGGAEKAAKITVPFKRNSLQFSFSASLYDRQPHTEFSYYLQGFDDTWSHWSLAHEKEYTNLPEGDYTFHVKARTSPSHESEPYQYSFTVLPPWYRTWWAYAVYALGALALLYALYKLQEKKHHAKQEARRLADQKKFEAEQRQLAYQHQLELEKNEKELIRLRNENLEAEIEHKNAELASTAMNLVQKKEFLLKITDELNKLNKQSGATIETTELKKILRSLSSEEKLDEEWNQFSLHFNNVHRDFLITLKNKFPHLSAHELKLCAYLRMNLTSKEMAQLMSISVRGVEINRYRLRKKLQLQPKEDLFQFLLNVEGLPDSNPGNDRQQ